MTEAVALRTHTPAVIRCAAALLWALALAASVSAQSATDGHTPSGAAPGAPAGSYPLSGFDDINFFNGHLNFSMPLVKLGGRGAAGHTVQLKIGRKWSTFKGPYSFYPTSSNWQGLSVGYGAGALEGRVAGMPDECSNASAITLLRLTFTAPDGTEYELRDKNTGGVEGWTELDVNCGTLQTQNRGRVFYTADGTSASFVSDLDITDMNGLGILPSGHMMLKDGTRFRIDSGRVTWMRDRNGNRTTYTYTNNTLQQVTDSLGRSVTFAYVSGAQIYHQITYQGVGAATRTLRVWFAPLDQAFRSGYVPQTQQQLFPELSGASSSTYNPNVISSLELPDGRRYYFRYNSYGELARVELPTGGALEYDWGAGLTGGVASGVMTTYGSHIYRRVVERRVYAGGGTGGAFTSRMTVSKPENTAGANDGYVTVEQRDAAGVLLSKERHYYHGSARASFNGSPLLYSGYKEGKEWKTEIFDTNGTTLLRQIEHTWQQPAGNALWPLVTAETSDNARPNDPQITQTVTTLVDASLVSKQTFAYDRYSNRTDVYEYDFGTGAPPAYALRRSQTTYVTTHPVNGQDYASPNPTQGSIHIRSLPQHQRVYAVNPSNGAQTLVAHTETLYDETTLAWYGAVTGWADPGAYRGNATKVRRWLDTTGAYVESRAEYDQVGNVTKSVDARNNETTFQFSSGYAYALPTQITSPVPDPTGNYGSTTGLVTTTAYDFSTGLVTSTTDANGKTATVEYNDPLDRPTKVNRPDTGWTSYDYGREQSSDYVRTRNRLNAAGVLTDAYQWFDGLGRPNRALSYENQESATPWLTTDVQYDALGRVVKSSLPYRSAGGPTPPTPAQWSGLKRVETEYDAQGRVRTATTMPDGAAVKTDYSGARVLVTDQADRQRISKTDVLGRLTEVWEVRTSDPASGTEAVSFPSRVGVPAVSAGYRTAYKYDALGNLRKVEQGAQSRFFAYDSLGRLIRAKNPEQGAFAADADFPALTDSTSGTANSQWSMGYKYDAGGNLLKRKDARNVVVTYAYDNLSRNTSVDYADTPQNPDLQRHYDGATNGRGRFWWDFVSSPQAWEKAEHVAIDAYDAAGRPLNRRQHFYEHNVWQWGPGYNVQYAYDLAGNVTGMVYPSGRTVNYSHDAAGRLASFTGSLGDGQTRTYADGLRYHELGGREQERFGTQTPVYNKSLYNSRGQLSEIRVSTYSITSPGNETNWNRGAVINHYSLQSWAGSGIDNNGNLRKQDVYIPNDDAVTGSSLTTQFYDYDSLNRLDVVREERGGVIQWRQDYAYDRFGNRTINPAGTSGGVNATQFSVDQNTNRLGVPAGSPSQMTYDAAGHLTYDTYTGQGTRAFDAEGRMISAQDLAGQTSAYTYDADGRRARRVTGGEGAWQVYGLGGELLAEYAAGAPPSSATKEYGYRAGELLVTAAATPYAPKIAAAAATASNTHSTPWAAANVLDGNANTSWSSGQFPAQWVQLDLGQSYDLTRVRMLVDQYPAGRTVHEVWGGATTASMSLLGFIDSTTQDQQWLQLTSPAASVRYLKVQTTVSPSWVGWREVEAYGRPSGSGSPINLALGRPATQSSEGWGGVASRAVDGNTDGAWGSNSVTHTAGGGLEWWHVDLGSVQALGEIKLWNRTDCCAERLSNFYVLVSDTPFASTDLAATLNQAGVSGYYTAGQGGRPTVVSVGRTGRYVRVQLSAAGTLSLAEVEVMRAGAAELRWLVADQLGTPRMAVDLTGSLSGVRRHDYLPFGEEIQAGTGGRTPAQGYAADTVRQKFTSQERDKETGLDYFRARYYASTQGRFTGVDPIFITRRRLLDPQAINLYAYVRNNPLSYFDPDGEEFKGTDGKKVVIEEVDGQLVIRSTNATKDLITLVNLINNSGSSTALGQFNRLNAAKTMINIVIDTTTKGGTRIGLHEPHGTRPGGSKGPLRFDSQTDKFEGQVDVVRDAGGNEVYAEATITLFEGELTKFYGANTAQIEDELVATFGHEAEHDLDPRQIQATKTGTGSDAIYHPRNRDGTPAPGSPYWMTYKILNEVKDARALRGVQCIHGTCGKAP